MPDDVVAPVGLAVLLDEEVGGDVVEGDVVLLDDVDPLVLGVVLPGMVVVDVVPEGEVVVDEDVVAGGDVGAGVTTVVDEDVGGADDDFGTVSWRWHAESASNTLAATTVVRIRWFICDLLCLRSWKA